MLLIQFLCNLRYSCGFKNDSNKFKQSLVCNKMDKQFFSCATDLFKSAQICVFISKTSLYIASSFVFLQTLLGSDSDLEAIKTITTEGRQLFLNILPKKQLNQTNFL